MPTPHPPFLPAIIAVALALCVPAQASLDTSPAASSPYQITPHLHGAPLPSGPDARLRKDLTVIHYQWLSRILLAHFPVDKDPQGAAFIKAALDPSVPRDKVIGMARAINMAKVTDAGLMYMIGWVEPDENRRSRTAFRNALGLYPRSVYPKFLWFIAALDVDGDARRPKPDAREAMDQTALDYLNIGLNDGSFQPGELPELRDYFLNDNFQGLLARHGDEVVALFKGGADVLPWLKDYVQGKYILNQAWSARGWGTYSSLTLAQINAFASALSQARQYLVKSWTENPHDPAAAADMISVCMGERERTETMRFWFDRAVAAQFDFFGAYGNMEHGLYPAWGGSYAEMNAFGDECAATGRYDTRVPDQRVIIAVDIIQDARERGRQFDDPKIAGQILKVVDAYMAQPQLPENVDMKYDHTVAAIAASHLGRMDEVRLHMAALNYRPFVDLWSMSCGALRLAKKVQPPPPPAPPAASPAAAPGAAPSASPAASPRAPRRKNRRLRAAAAAAAAAAASPDASAASPAASPATSGAAAQDTPVPAP